MAPGNSSRLPLVVLAADDPVVSARLARIARDRDLALSAAPPPEGQPTAAVLDIDAPGAVRTVQDWRERWPDTLIAGFSALPDPARWTEAQRGGCDLVVNRGALGLRLAARLDDHLADRGGRRFPLFEAADAAGRLGLVFRTEESPVGPLAVYRAGGRLCAVADRCPHAGQTLSDGELDGTVITCPRHGSQFEVGTGERVRGPADCDITTYSVVQEGGQILLVLR